MYVHMQHDELGIKKKKKKKKKRLAENLMKICFKCINVVDYGPEVFNI